MRKDPKINYGVKICHYILLLLFVFVFIWNSFFGGGKPNIPLCLGESQLLSKDSLAHVELENKKSDADQKGECFRSWLKCLFISRSNWTSTTL